MNTIQRQPTLLLALVALLAAIACAARASAQGKAEVQAAFDRPTAYLGDTVTFSIEAQGEGPVEFPPTLNLEHAQTAPTAQSRSSYSTQRREGNRIVTEQVASVRQDYAVRPTRAGDLVIPPQAVTVAGVRFTTPEARLRVLEPERSPDDTLELVLDRDRVYVGEKIGFRLVMSVADASDASVPDFSLLTLPQTLEVSLPPARSRGRSARLVAVSVLGRRTDARVVEDRANLPRGVRIVVEGEMVPGEPGAFTLDDLRVTYDRTTPGRERRVLVTGEPVRLEVLAVPSEGMPTGFNGLVGVYDVTADASPTDVNVGDPIELTVTVLGREPMRGVRDGPDLAATPGFTPGFKLASEGWRFEPAASEGRRSFKTVVRAAREDLTEIPPIELHFFDPATETFRVARTDAIPISVRAARRVTAADAVVGGASATTLAAGPPPAPTAQVLTPGPPGVWAIDTGPGVLRGRPLDAAPTLGLTSAPSRAAAFAAIPVALYAAASIAASLRARRDPAAARRRSAIRRGLAALRQGDAATAVRGYLADVFARPADTISSADCESLLRAADPADVRALTDLVALAEAERFGGRATPRGDLGNAQALLRRADAALRRAGR